MKYSMQVCSKNDREEQNCLHLPLCWTGASHLKYTCRANCVQLGKSRSVDKIEKYCLASLAEMYSPWLLSPHPSGQVTTNSHNEYISPQEPLPVFLII